jgi:hypothetical protein
VKEFWTRWAAFIGGGRYWDLYWPRDMSDPHGAWGFGDPDPWLFGAVGGVGVLFLLPLMGEKPDTGGVDVGVSLTGPPEFGRGGGWARYSSRRGFAGGVDMPADLRACLSLSLIRRVTPYDLRIWLFFEATPFFKDIILA